MALEFFYLKVGGIPKKYSGGGGREAMGNRLGGYRKVEGSYNFQITLLQIPLAPHTP